MQIRLINGPLEGADGYTIEECEKDEAGTVITLYIKEDTDNDDYSQFLEQYRLSELIKNTAIISAIRLKWQ